MSLTATADRPRVRYGGLRAALDRVVPTTVFVVLPLVLVTWALASAFERGVFALDFHHAFRPAGRAVIDGTFAYPRSIEAALGSGDPFVYPPLTALGFAPFALIPSLAADVAYTVVAMGATVLAVRVLGVRDWRCYGMVFLWPPVIAAAQAGNLSLLLVLPLALVWRLRDRPLPVALLAVVVVSAKLFLWPILVWFLLTRRVTAAALTCLLAVVLNAAAWIAVGAGSLSHYVELVQRLGELQGPFTYTFAALAERSGVPPSGGEVVRWSVVGLVLYGCWRARGDDRASFSLAVVVGLVASPIVWLHYFALLVVPVAVSRSRLGWPWFIPFAMILCPGRGNGTYVETVVALSALGVVAASVLLPSKPTVLRARIHAG